MNLILLNGSMFGLEIEFMRKIDTKFPTEIDDRMFFQDISIPQIPIMNEYYKCLSSANYTMASELLNNSEVFFYGAWLLNLLENRLYQIGKYLFSLNKEPLVAYTDTMPSGDTQTHWIGSNN